LQGGSFYHFATPLRAFTRYISDRPIGEFRLAYETYRTRRILFSKDTYVRLVKLTYSILAYAYPRAVASLTTR